MRLRTFLSLIILLGLAGSVVFLLLPNRVVLEQPLDLAGHPVPVWGAILGALALGVFLTLSFELTGIGRKALEQASTLWSRRNRRAAQRALERGLQAERDDRLDDAVAHLREAVDRDPSDFRAQMELGTALRRAGRPADAILAHEWARRLDPDSDEPGHALATDHLEAGDSDATRRELEGLIDSSPRGAIGPLRQLRDLEIQAGRWSTAARLQRRLETLHGRHRILSEADQNQGLGIRVELARARFEAGQLKSALAMARRLVGEAPQFIAARILLAQVHEGMGSIDAARDTLLDGFQRTGEPVLLEALCELDLEREKPEEAISTLRGLVATRRWPSARLVLGHLYFRLEMLDDAARPLGDLLEEEGFCAPVAHLLAQVEERRGNIFRANALYRMILESSPEAASPACCSTCRTNLPEWAPRCSKCGQFGSVATTLPSPTQPSAGTPAPAPVYPTSS